VTGDIPAFMYVLIAGLLMALAGMLITFAETRAVRNMSPWPFRLGLTVVRLRRGLAQFHSPASDLTLTQSAEVRVVSPSECLFVPQHWRSQLSWSGYPQRTSPFALKGRAVSHEDGTEVVGRLSLAATLGIPGIMIWLGGCGLLAASQSLGMAAILVLAGVLAPAGLTWVTLPKEAASFRGLWQEVSESFLDGMAGGTRGGPTKS